MAGWWRGAQAVIQAIAGPGVSPTQTFEFAPSERARPGANRRHRVMEPMMPAMFKKTWGQYRANLKQILAG